MSTTTEKISIYERVTQAIVAQLERGVRPWHQPWKSTSEAGPVCRPLRHTGEAYRGINVLCLWASAMDSGYCSPIWLTFKQALELGGNVRKGEHGSPVVYANQFVKRDVNDAGEESERAIPFLKAYTVFNAEQCDGLPVRFTQYVAPLLATFERNERAESFLEATGARVVHGGSQACYSLTADEIRLPQREHFESVESYYSTRSHETIHWTRHESRLKREFGRKRFGDAGYALEELVAELGAAFLCADLQVTPDVRADHAEYLAHWLVALKHDSRAIFNAAAHAQRAVEFLQPKAPAENQAMAFAA